MKRILVINGVGLNMLGIREPEIYGKKSYGDLEKFIEDSAKELGLNVEIYQSNYEGAIVEKIHSAYKLFDGIIINAGAYTHTSVAILDALRAVNIKTVEVHLSDIYGREDFRKVSFISLFAEKQIVGLGFDGYKEALKYFA